MDELSLFQGASSRLCEMEKKLFQCADLVFTGGTSLFEAKRQHHSCVYAFPSGVDVPHFLRARSRRVQCEEQNYPAFPRIGYCGVIDERLDLELIDKLSERRPAWQIVMLGPVVKIHPGCLPRRDNLHWLGMKDYRDLPQYFAEWDIGLLPFAMNDATRFISPTKTPEYLAAGLHVVSTPIRDVVTPYGDLGMAMIAHTTDEFISACDSCIARPMSPALRIDIDAFLGTLSWDSTWDAMNRLIQERLEQYRGGAEVLEENQIHPGPTAIGVLHV
jgi:UDP-galactopyranose mutase